MSLPFATVRLERGRPCPSPRSARRSALRKDTDAAPRPVAVRRAATGTEARAPTN